MRIGILGSAPSSLALAPFGDPSWRFFGCSPGVYYQCPRVDAWFELHRWEPPIIGNPHKQQMWFSPEYVAWMGSLKCPVWMYDRVPEIPNSRPLPVEELTAKYGTYFFTSSIAFMIACAIEDILEAREAGEHGPHEIGLFGVDMAATEEWAEQRPGCQHFLLLAADLGITVTVPPESDLLRPMPLYGVCESSHWMIKNTARRKELEGRLAHATQAQRNAELECAFLKGALDDLTYQMKTWGEDRQGVGTNYEIMAKMPKVRALVQAALPPVIVAAPAPVQVEEAPAPRKRAYKRKPNGEDGAFSHLTHPEAIT